MDAEGRAALIDAVEAVVRADAGADILLALLDDLAHDMRVGHMRPRHADHVHLSRRDRVAGGRDVGDLRGMEGREVGRGADLAGEIEMR